MDDFRHALKDARKNAQPYVRNILGAQQNTLKQTVDTVVHYVEVTLITQLLRLNHGHRLNVSRQLGVPYRTLLWKIAQYGIDVPTPKPGAKVKRCDVTARTIKAHLFRLLPKPLNHALLFEDWACHSVTLDTLASDYGLSVEATRAIIFPENNTRPEKTGGDNPSLS